MNLMGTALHGYVIRSARRALSMAPLAALMVTIAGCGPATPTTQTPDTGTATPTATTTGPAVDPGADTSDPFAIEGLLREEQLPLLKGPAPVFDDIALAPPPKGVPAAPASCDAYVKRASKAKIDCGDRAKALDALDKALAQSNPDARDEQLQMMEACAGLDAGVVRVLRIELAPGECGDVLAEPVLKGKPAGMSGAVQHALVGQAIAARLTRTVSKPPELAGPFTKDKVLAFSKKKMLPWFDEQATAVEHLSKQGQKLASYGKGLVALASGWANLRLVEAVREVPIPDEFKKDPEVANAYYGSLDEKLEPKKREGRDGALVGLGEMANAGVIEDERTRTTRALLSKMYGGRRVDGLDVLSRPARLPAADDTVPARLAGKLPTFVAGVLLDPATAKEEKVMRSLLHRGVPVRFRAALKDDDAALGNPARALYARARLELAIRYWRAVDVDAAIALYSKIPAKELSSRDRHDFALAIALRFGPEHVAALMLSNEPFSQKFGDVRALDRITKEGGDPALAGVAAFNAGIVRQIATPRDADVKYWQALEERFKDAAAKLTDVNLRHEADERAKAAGAFVKVLKTTAP